MCRQFGITRAAYYKWLARDIPETEKENETIAHLIREYDDRFNHILGYRRMTDWINLTVSMAPDTAAIEFTVL